jgi:hypothetical protein
VGKKLRVAFDLGRTIMKKELLISLFLALTTGMAFAQAQVQGKLSTTTKARSNGELSTTLPKPRPPAAAPFVPTEGAVQVAIRTGRPIQLINPAAPARYGNAQEHVMHDPNDPGKPKGISLFAWSF